MLKANGTPPEPEGPCITFEPPAGWSAERVSEALHIRKGDALIGQARLIDDFSYRKILRSNEIRDRTQNQTLSSIDGCWTKFPVRFGDSHGLKFLFIQKSPRWKRVQYLLEMPDGKAMVVLDASGEDFDEIPFEDSLKTLRITQAA